MSYKEHITGVYTTSRKDGSIYYRTGITINNRHISLGSFDDADRAGCAYKEACHIFSHKDFSIGDYSDCFCLSFQKAVMLINYRDNGLYFKTPVYIYKKYFLYYYDPDNVFRFDADDLFFYTTHSIMKRGSHLFVADYGMQINILSRYGIKEHAVVGRDYYFANQNPYDFSYGNIIIINPYHGVFHYVKNGRDYYKVKIHINGDYVVGNYPNVNEAAIAYNKAANILKSKGVKKSFPENFPESLSAISYASIYNSVKISKKILNYSNPL